VRVGGSRERERKETNEVLVTEKFIAFTHMKKIKKTKNRKSLI
jgi:hypothetical protein